MRSDRLCPVLTMELLQFYYSRFTAQSDRGRRTGDPDENPEAARIILGWPTSEVGARREFSAIDSHNLLERYRDRAATRCSLSDLNVIDGGSLTSREVFSPAYRPLLGAASACTVGIASPVSACPGGFGALQGPFLPARCKDYCCHHCPKAGCPQQDCLRSARPPPESWTLAAAH